MASYDRDYQRDGGRRVGMPGLPPVTKWLLILNVGIFLVDMWQRPEPTVPGGVTWGPLNEGFCFTVYSAFREFRIWELVTFQFLHNDLLHVLFNCLWIYYFGRFVEQWWGSKYYLRFYLLCGVAGALFFTLLFVLGVLPKASIGSPLVGASAGVFGILAAVYVIAPAARVRLLIPPIELSMKQLAIALTAISVLTIIGGLFVSRHLNEGGEAGHLGGLIMGLVLMKFPWLVKWKMPERKVIRPKEFRRRKVDAKIRPRTEVELDEETEVDRILDKISAKGLESLTEEEKGILERSANKE